eukprot:8410000-Alexandrium_andersonii.AAC.1
MAPAARTRGPTSLLAGPCGRAALTPGGAAARAAAAPRADLVELTSLRATIRRTAAPWGATGGA